MEKQAFPTSSASGMGISRPRLYPAKNHSMSPAVEESRLSLEVSEAEFARRLIRAVDGQEESGQTLARPSASCLLASRITYCVVALLSLGACPFASPPAAAAAVRWRRRGVRTPSKSGLCPDTYDGGRTDRPRKSNVYIHILLPSERNQFGNGLYVV